MFNLKIKNKKIRYFVFIFGLFLFCLGNIVQAVVPDSEKPTTFSESAPDPTIPTLTSLSPASGNQGQTLNVNLFGTNFSNDETSNFLVYFGPDIFVNSTRIVNDRQLLSNITIPISANLGTHNVIVRIGNQTTSPQTFMVNSFTSCLFPTISYLSPYSAITGSESIFVTIYGSNFKNETSALFNGLVRTTNVINSNKLTMILTEADLSNPGIENIQVSNGVNCISNSVNFRINSSFEEKNWWDPTNGKGWWWNFVYQKKVVPPITTEDTIKKEIASQNQDINTQKTSVSDLIDEQKTKFLSSFSNWLIVFVVILIIAFILARIRSRHKKDRNL